MSRHKFTSVLFPTAGIALADILANSVAVILILITLSLNIKQQQAEKQFNQTVDINVLMARKMADSVVMNSLPNSKPAYLHNYQDCRIPHDCNPSLYPIIELHKNAIREQNSNIVISKEQLMKQTNNPLDILLTTYTQNQINNLRVDVYDISVFYLAISIFREFNAPLRHWHFLGEGNDPSPSSNKLENDNKIAELLEEGEYAVGEYAANSESSSKQSGELAVPQDADIVNPELIAGLEEEQFLPPPNIEQLQQQGQQSDNGQTSSAQSLTEQMLSEFSRQRQGQEMAQSENRIFSLNLPNMTETNNPDAAMLSIPEDLYEEIMLTYLLMAMELGRNNKGFEMKQLEELLAMIVLNPNTIEDFRLHPWVNNMAAHLRSLEASNDEGLPIITENSLDSPLLLKLAPNTATTKFIFNNEDVLVNSWLPENIGKVDLLFRNVPYVHRGERIAINDNYIFLIHPDDIENPKLSWRTAAIFDPRMENVSLGFVFSAFKEGKLDLPAEVNQVRVDKQHISSFFSLFESRTSWLLAILYFLVSVSLITLVFWITKRANFTETNPYAKG